MEEITEQMKAYALARWQARAGLFSRVSGWAEAARAATPEESVWFRYLAGTLPVQDISQYEPKMILDFARHGAMLRRERDWCQALPEEMFAKYVLCPRVNDEALSPCREEFHRRLFSHVSGLSLEEAIQAVNAWCCRHVTYRSTDDRTSSALDIYRRGYGRCGEESVFAVNALRSVGIAARQVYAPRWSHCDDNHAWVEAWDGKDWRFLGACEPEPQLDMGWFTAAAGRAMLANTKIFVTGSPQEWAFLFPETHSLDLECREGLVLESVTARYGETRPFAVKVAGADGRIVPGIKLGFYLLNEGALWEIARGETGEDGMVRRNLGLGSLWIRAEGYGGAEMLVHTGQSPQVTLVLSGQAPPASFDFVSPADRGQRQPNLSEEARAARAALLESCRQSRKQWARQHKKTWLEDMEEVAASLTRKDRDDGPARNVLTDALPANQHRDRLLAEGMKEEDFRAFLLSPRIQREPLAPWRQLLAQVLPGLSPPALWAATKAHRPLEPGWEALPQTPAGAWLVGPVNFQAREVLFCALCRARGIPARPGISGPEYWADGAFHSVEDQPPGEVLLQGAKPQGGCLGLMKIGGESLIPLGQVEFGRPISLPVGKYRVIAAARLPNGNQLAEYRDFSVRSGEMVRLALEFRQGRPEELLQRLALPDVPVEGASLLALLAGSPLSLVCWTEPGSEPTQHLVNELAEHGEKLEALGCRVHMISGESAAAEAVARRMYLEPGRLPLAVLADREGNGLFASAGYNVGSVELTAGLAALALEERKQGQ